MLSVSKATFSLDEVFKILDDDKEKDKIGKICQTIHGQLLDPQDIVKLFENSKEKLDNNQLMQIFKNVQIGSKYEFKSLIDLINTFRNVLDLPVFDYFRNFFSILLSDLDETSDAVKHCKHQIAKLRNQIQSKEEELKKLSRTIAMQSKQIEEQRKCALRVAQLEKEILAIRDGTEAPILQDIKFFVLSSLNINKNPTKYFKLFEDYTLYPNLIPKAIKENLITYQDNDVPYSLLLEAIRQGDAKLTRELISNGASLDVKDYMGSTPLHVAINSGNMEVCQIILSKYKKIDINAQDNFGNTPLHLASMYGIAPIIDTLCNCPKIKLDIKNSQGKTPLDCVSLDDGGLCQAILIAFGD
ncbi:hypothetical protein TVAG_416600 [Trichomonas vaginalis G3]|uniref:Uncharacterized protein n=1 Tax=Trichomonas vaginalis (strain ATCC PRA-98 / G3) TaxID=412133 RepID=A2EQQ2_TRIV3|nr:guanyl-nucleotide exchange factor protein [Trichomonas vaginalis G3]EAY05017.1 hypothetical protein TVAG_416600 [Trichomonas vaginalis G3]KAI5502941.1 guanyl-nucleotide exchange factor protein [Trichomonas vaginalis G3]|eukprot:XP_001317240.1 hypothetical protein [Trichomonas vaginalis G3]